MSKAIVAIDGKIREVDTSSPEYRRALTVDRAIFADVSAYVRVQICRYCGSPLFSTATSTSRVVYCKQCGAPTA